MDPKKGNEEIQQGSLAPTKTLRKQAGFNAPRSARGQSDELSVTKRINEVLDDVYMASSAEFEGRKRQTQESVCAYESTYHFFNKVGCEHAQECLYGWENHSFRQPNTCVR